MTLVWLAVTLAVIVFGAVFAVWTVRVHTIRSDRMIELHRRRIVSDIEALGDDRQSRKAWAAHRLDEYEYAMAFTLARSDQRRTERLTELLDPYLTEVVA